MPRDAPVLLATDIFAISVPLLGDVVESLESSEPVNKKPNPSASVATASPSSTAKTFESEGVVAQGKKVEDTSATSGAGGGAATPSPWVRPQIPNLPSTPRFRRELLGRRPPSAMTSRRWTIRRLPQLLKAPEVTPGPKSSSGWEFLCSSGGSELMISSPHSLAAIRAKTKMTSMKMTSLVSMGCKFSTEYSTAIYVLDPDFLKNEFRMLVPLRLDDFNGNCINFN